MVDVNDEQNRVKVTIFGQSYTLRGSGSSERLTRLAALVDGKMNALFDQNSRLDFQTLAVLTALNLAEEYDTISSEYDSLLSALELEIKK
ncbi:Cell division protein ZapA [Acidibacillus sp. S0AB]|uniref:Cell division protein ZapA n=2 Tax=Sulfoacidibacillus ferrooxidans TaxID=2005001 RepID=A0A9X1V6E9_9BACL|nr:cell division protein ZapA [Sulfoacidibacillus ferrooxidans]MCI0182042.1 Cell division protein ZapA [Sulfoacidibacillus ferrooxidans]